MRQDHWWTIDADTSFDALGDEIEQHVIQLVIPKIDRYIGDEALRDLWLSGRSPGLGDRERVRNLVVLLKALGPENQLGPVLESMRRYGD